MQVKIDQSNITKNFTIEEETPIDILTPKQKSKFVTFISNWYVTIIVVIVIIALIAGGFSIFNSSKSSSGSYSNQTDTSNLNIKSYTPKTVYLESPVNGELTTEDNLNQMQKNKVLTVMIENLAGPIGARPQAGLQDADVVYETIVEGDITRFMGVFWNHSADSDQTTKLMPVRSARKYFVDWLQEYSDPLFMHIGQATSTDENTNADGALIKYKIKDVSGASNSFDRDKICEQQKAQEHCAYSDTKRLWSIGTSRNWTNLGDLQKLIYKDDKAIDPQATASKTATNIKIEFQDDPANYSAVWKYDSDTNTYLRSQGNTPHLDQATKQQLFTKVLVIQKTSIQEISSDALPDEHPKYHKVIKTVGSGDAWIVQDGKIIDATWKKDTLTSRTRYFDRTTKKELSLDRGQMWITVTSNAPVIK